MANSLKNFLRPFYRLVRSIVVRVFLTLRYSIVKLLLPQAYGEELAFFEDIRSRNYNDQEYLSKITRMLTHYVDKTFTLSETVNKAVIARQVEAMARDMNKDRQSDRITYQWVNDVLGFCKNSQKNAIKEPLTIPAHAPDTLSDIIKTRRSIRSYKSQKIENTLLDRILGAGLWAPSGCNRQAIEYLVVDDPQDVLFCQKYAGEFHGFPREAAVNIVILVDPRGYALPRQRHMAYLEGGAAIQNILLMAHSLGLGSCWMFWAKLNQEFNERFHLPSWLLPVGLVCMGYTDRQPPIVPKRKCTDDCIHDRRRKDKYQ